MSEHHQVAVVMGGTSPEREVSLVSGKAVAEGLRQAGETVFEVVANDHQLHELDDLPVDVVFIALHGTWGEDGGVQELLESKGLPYTGSGVEASRWGMDKLLSKQAFAARRVSTAPYEPFAAGDGEEDVAQRAESLGFPLVVKPRAQGSSIGVHIVRRPEDLSAAVADALRYGSEGLLEAFVAGRELTVGMLDDEPLPIIEIQAHREFFDFEAKYQEGVTEHVFDVAVSPEVYRYVQEASADAYRALGCRGFARVDLRLSREAEPFILEVNTIPGFTPVSLLPEAARRRGLHFPDLCYRLVSLALRDGHDARCKQLTNQPGG